MHDPAASDARWTPDQLNDVTKIWGSVWRSPGGKMMVSIPPETPWIKGGRGVGMGMVPAPGRPPGESELPLLTLS